MSTCDECGGDVQVGDWPFCGGDPKSHVPMTHFGEDPLTPYMDENLLPYPVEIRTRGERRRIMSRQHLDYADVGHSKRGKIYVHR